MYPSFKRVCLPASTPRKNTMRFLYSRESFICMQIIILNLRSAVVRNSIVIYEIIKLAGIEQSSQVQDGLGWNGFVPLKLFKETEEKIQL